MMFAVSCPYLQISINDQLAMQLSQKRRQQMIASHIHAELNPGTVPVGKDDGERQKNPLPYRIGHVRHATQNHLHGVKEWQALRQDISLELPDPSVGFACPC